MISNTSSGPAVKATGAVVSTNAATLTLYTKGATSISSQQPLSIIGSSLRSRVGLAGNSEFVSPGAVTLVNCTLDMAYGLTNQLSAGSSNCVWAGKVRYSASVSTQGPTGNSSTGTTDAINLSIFGQDGSGISATNIGQGFSSKFNPGTTNVFYFSDKAFFAVVDHVVFTNTGTDPWFPGVLTLSSATCPAQKLPLYNWVGSKQSTTFFADDLCMDVMVTTANQSGAGTTAQVYLALVHDGGKQEAAVRIDNAGSCAFNGNTVSKLTVSLGRAGSVAHPEGIVLWTAANGTSPQPTPGPILKASASAAPPPWILAGISLLNNAAAPYAGYCSMALQPALRVIDSTPKFLGLADTNTGEFEVTVQTADIQNAGTAANIYLKIYGSSGVTAFQDITHIPTYSAFLQGYTDTFRIAYTNGIGIPQKIELYEDQSGSKPNWYCQYVEVAPVEAFGGVATVYHFDVNHNFQGSEHMIETNSGVRDETPVLGELAPVSITVSGAGTLSPDWRGATRRYVGDSLQVTATPAPGYFFAGWTGSIATNGSSLQFTMARGLAFEAHFAPLGGAFNGLFHPTNDVTQENSGFISVKVNAKGSYSGRLQIAGGGYSLSGRLDANGEATCVINRRGQSPLTVQLHASGEDWMSGRVSTEGWVAEISADRNVYDSKTRPAPEAGRYTMAIAGVDGVDNLPRGCGYGTLSVSKAGLIDFGGSLADGSKVSQSVPISQQGQWPLYASLNSGQGSLLGWIGFSNAARLRGALVWTKPATPKGPFPPAFACMSLASGSRYEAPGKGSNVLGAASSPLMLSLSGGGLPDTIENSFILGSGNQVQDPSLTERLRLSFTAASGLFSGSQGIPGTGKSVSFRGVVLQEQGTGAGYFQGAEQTGRIWFESAH